MAQEKQVKQLIKIFTTIVRKTTDPTFKFSEGGVTKKVLTNFLDAVAKENGSISESRLVDICVFTAYIYKDKLLPVKSMFSKATLKYFSSSKRGARFYENQWLGEKGLSRADFVEQITDRREHALAGFIYMPSEESRKLRLHNLKTGFFSCQASTLGWSPLSDACNNCIFIEECKTETSIKYPELYRLRQEHGNKGNRRSSD